VWGGIVNKAYTFQITFADAIGTPAWSVIAGSLPPGLSLNGGTAVISGTPTTAGVYTFTIQGRDNTSTITRDYTTIISPNDTQYGNVGDPYATEGGFADPTAIPLTTCQTLVQGKSYRMVQNITAATPGTTCFTSAFTNTATNIKLDLGGFTLSGRIVYNTNPNGLKIFNGVVNCNFPDNGGLAGCVNVSGTHAVTTGLQIHHLTIMNAGNHSRSIHLDWAAPSPVTVPSVRVYNITASVFNQPTVDRSHAINMATLNQYVNVYSNDLTCQADASACQAIVCQDTFECKQHHNRVNLVPNTTSISGRGLVMQATGKGEMWNNQVSSNDNRAVRIRISAHIRVHDNVFLMISANRGEGALHLGDPDSGDDDMDTRIDNNSFELAGGNVILIRSAFNALFRENTFTCNGACNLSTLATVRTPNTTKGGVRTELTFENNPSVTLFASPPQIQVETGATANICNSGTGGPLLPSGRLGTIIPVASCP
jgi:hypothetical protein